ncbi:ParB/RepB/Spo0J family partition protein [Jannaschia sp. LMIT008]|uniref:ParB/RepB/Spo0J family partition protein n=1 Tax=Jannaschia maritima TaxID=3032585 RepID=UPI002811D787|nr:ParB/RepB/Spo0J family partition protein [Jannaschia sp. LMIT008]
MPDDTKRRALGRGLSALMADLEPATTSGDGMRIVPIDLIRRNEKQPRRTFDPDRMEELAGSIRDKGLLQPIVVRPDPNRTDGYEIVAGERRWRAAQQARLHDVPIVVRDIDDREMLELAIVENIQRVDLDPIDEAWGFQQLIDRFDHTQEQISKALGKSRSHVANQLRLLKLPDAVQGMLRDGKLSAGHARALLTAPDSVGLAHQVVAKGLSVRETERLAKTVTRADGSQGSDMATAVPSGSDADTIALQQDIGAALGMVVTIKHGRDGGGTVSIRYKSLDQLDNLCEALSQVGSDLAAR